MKRNVAQDVDGWVIDPEDDSDTLPVIPMSGRPCGRYYRGFYCSRSEGHRGSHAASGTQGTYAVWRT